MVKAIAFDVGMKRDAFAAVSAEITSSNILLGNAKEWFSKDITNVADEIAEIHKTAKFDRFICESNNQGYPVIDLLKRYHKIYCIPITTVKELKNKEKIRQGKSMPKNVTVEWVEWARKSDILLMPNTLSPGLKRLEEQMSRYVRKSTASGTKYQAEEEEDHDDLVSALLILCHYARTKVLSIGYKDIGAIASRRLPNALDLQKTTEEITTERMRKRVQRHFPNIPDEDIKVNIHND